MKRQFFVVEYSSAWCLATKDRLVRESREEAGSELNGEKNDNAWMLLQLQRQEAESETTDEGPLQQEDEMLRGVVH